MLPRLDRFLTLYFFYFFSKRVSPKKGIRIPILMYHSISDEKEKGHPYFWINTTPQRFTEHMQYLHDNSYKVISLSEAVEIIRSIHNDQLPMDSMNPIQPTSLNPHCCNRGRRGGADSQAATCSLESADRLAVLTFDDGYRDFYTNAFPLLQGYGFPATMFLATAFIGDRPESFKGRQCLTWSEVRELSKLGVTFGSHSRSHSRLFDLKPDAIRAELLESRRVIESKLGKEIRTFCYPYAFPEENKDFVTRLRAVLKDAGYVLGVTTKIGMAAGRDDPLFLPRIPVNHRDDLGLFSAKLVGAYNWVHVLQSGLRRVRRISSAIGWGCRIACTVMLRSPIGFRRYPR